ncbi:MAG: hypothetical protein IPG59_11250 [Candidatus Melainabacteria bacterium]|nr:MAG: hypothetical protein IPG59_11250 [Candidatus Melainabacteria bacterium]
MTDLLKKMRDDYLKCLRRSAREYLESHEKSACELMFTDPNIETFVRKLFRVDLCSNEGGLDVLEVNLDTAKQEVTSLILESNLEVILNPCVWNDVKITCEVFDGNDSAFLLWFEKWFDTDEVNAEDSYGLYNVVHSVAVERIEVNYELGIDFGSSEVDSLLELLDILHAQGNKSVMLSSSKRTTQASR